MSISILSTKFYVPPPRESVVARPHLVEKLLSGLSRQGSLTLVSGPAGFGKTTLLSEFVSQLQQSAAWVSLDEGDNDPVQFWTYLITACRPILEDVGESALELFSTQQSLPDDTVPTLLINDLTANDRPILLVLDDYHTIQTPSIHAGLQFLLDHLPHNLHIIISTRTDPPWPLARLRASNQLIEIRAQDLRFSIEEAAEFLNRTMGLNLSHEDIAALEERTEGWAAGLQLAALSIQGRSDTTAFVKAFTGSNLYIAEYLVEEVLQRQSEDVRNFLLQTSVLKRMNAGLCEAVTDCQDGQAILQSLQHANTFLISLDNEGQWFRYHHLFADLLQARVQKAFPKDKIAALHGRASVWYEHTGFPSEAVNHALVAKDYERAAELVKNTAHTLIFSGQVRNLKDWLEALPETILNAHPQLTFYKFWIDILQSNADLSEAAIREKEERLKALPSSPENDRLRGELMAVVCRAVALSGHTSEGIRLAQGALAYLPPDSLAARARALSALATAYDLEGRAEEAEQFYQESFSQAISAGDYRLAAHTTMAKGLIQGHYGKLREASRTFQSIIDLGSRVESSTADKIRASKVFFPAGQGYIGLGCIHLEWNNLDAAERYLERGMDLCRQGGLDGIFIGKVRMSRLRQAKGDLIGALEEIQIPQQIKRVDNFNLVTRQIQIALAKEDVNHAKRLAAPLAEMLERDPDSIQMPLLFFENLEAVIARVYLARGEFEKALQLLNRLQASAETGKRTGCLIEVYLLKALVYQKQEMGRLAPEAIESIEHALELGEPEGYVLLFLEEGMVVAPLLNAIIERRAAHDRLKKYARNLLDAFSGIAKPTTPQPGKIVAGMIELLTPREMEVLERLAAGDSNQAIAKKLVITVRTVKKHTSNIYGKLNSSSRTQAVARARELGLLSTD
jgi:LuxR family transcriptional regulator, maltose regulon positive regulatory protein